MTGIPGDTHQAHPVQVPEIPALTRAEVSEADSIGDLSRQSGIV